MSAQDGTTKRRHVAVLHQGPIDSPQRAVQAAIVAEHGRKDKMMDSNKYVHLLKRHLEAVTEMLTEVIENCPDDLWVESPGGRSPVWHQVYHAVSGNDFWLRKDFSEAFRPLKFGKDISGRLGRLSDANLSKQEMSEYMAHVKEKATQLFDFLDDERLLEQIGAGPLPNETYGDALIGQIRHMQYHVSECNVRLGDDGAKAAEWIDPSHTPNAPA